MANTRVIFISEITVGSKFRVIANKAVHVKAAKRKGTSWASCLPKDGGGNFTRPSFTDMTDISMRRHQVLNASFGIITVYPPTFNVLNRPCPWAIGHSFKQGAKP